MNNCIDCKKKISKGCTRCLICSNKYRKGFQHTETTKKKQSTGKLGNKNPMWKGEEVSYHKLHSWVRRHKPKKKFCEICGKETKLEICNLSGEYKRDLEDYAWYCRTCHRKRDKEFRERNRVSGVIKLKYDKTGRVKEYDR